MLTHQNERPEKCPIATCDYHIKGFARKYDKTRHTLTHYKGTMVCGFCRGSGSAAEKSFNRADVFKRHLTAVHGVEQTPPNSRKKTFTSVSSGKKLIGYAPDATGKCSTCPSTFFSTQNFYEHLDECLLRCIYQDITAVQSASSVPHEKMTHAGRDITPRPNQKIKTTRSDHSSLGDPGKGQVNMAEHSEGVFDGPNCVVKDETTLSTEHEVSIDLANGRVYAINENIQTLKREGFVNSTEEEKGAWISNDTSEDGSRKMPAGESNVTEEMYSRDGSLLPDSFDKPESGSFKANGNTNDDFAIEDVEHLDEVDKQLLGMTGEDERAMTKMMSWTMLHLRSLFGILAPVV
jgi:hypothetical protein